jgi:hypothetical protein
MCGEEILPASNNGLEILCRARQNAVSLTRTFRDGNSSVVDLDEPAPLVIDVEAIGSDDFFERGIESTV